MNDIPPATMISRSPHRNPVRFCLAGVLLSLLLAVSPVLAGESLVVTQARKAVTLSGFTRAATTMTLATEVSGKILSLGYDVGQSIAKAPHALIDTTFVDFQIQNIRQSIRKIEVAQRQNDSRVAYLKREFERMDRLHKGDRTTEVRRDAAEEEYLQSRLEGETLGVEKAALEISFKEAQERKQRHRISAPEGWVLVSKRAEAGEVVTANAPLATVADFGHLVVPLSVSAEELEAIRALGKEFEARLENAPATLRLKWVNPEFDEKTRKLGIELVVTRHEVENRGGLRLTLPLETAAEGLRIPAAAVINRYENPRVTLKSSGEVIPIQILSTSNGHLLIADHPRLSVGTELAPPAPEEGTP